MPKIVDKEAVRKEILMAFERCIEKKMIESISIRDIAAEAGMSHPTLLHYFENKEELLVAYVQYTCDYMSEHCKKWFFEHNLKDYESRQAYVNAFMQYVAEGAPGETRPNATTQTYVLGHYNEKIGKLVSDEFRQWRETMEKCLVAIYGPEVGANEAEAMMILITGTFICNYNHAITGKINNNIIGYISNLTK